MSGKQQQFELSGASVKSRLDDLSPMPFGKHEGTPMQDVPSSYLHYLWQKGLKSDSTSNVNDYIRRNLSALQQENPDLIWE
jgi:hypothetical protein